MATATLTPSTNHRIGNPALVGTLAGVAAGAMAVAGLGMAFLASRQAAGKDFVPATMLFDNYIAVTTAATLLLASAAVGWAVTALRIGHRRWASSGFALAALLDFAALNLIWFLAKETGLAVQGSEYAVLVYAVMTAAGVAIAIGLVAAVVGFARVLGAQTSSAQPHLGRASAWTQHLGTAAWLAAWGLIYLRK
jgi:heme/copper-type cytochrome/quinol oxidase subunit 3